MKDRTYGPGQDMLSMYDQDVLLLLVFVVKEMLAVLEFVNHCAALHSIVLYIF
jgi:hypothetical protein